MRIPSRRKRRPSNLRIVSVRSHPPAHPPLPPARGRDPFSFSSVLGNRASLRPAGSATRGPLFRTQRLAVNCDGMTCYFVNLSGLYRDSAASRSFVLSSYTLPPYRSRQSTARRFCMSQIIHYGSPFRDFSPDRVRTRRNSCCRGDSSLCRVE